MHSTFSDGESTLAENVRAARERALRTLCLVDHVRRDTAWLPEFAAAVAALRDQRELRILAGVEAKILDTSGRLDLPPGLDGIDLVLIADHQFPGDGGPVHPAEARAAIGRGEMTPAEAIERLCEASANALSATDRGRVLAHLFSVLPKIGLDEAMVPEALLTRLASTDRGRGSDGRDQREVGVPVGPHDRRHGAAPASTWWRAATATTAATWASTAPSG